jgi:signal peptidase II
LLVSLVLVVMLGATFPFAWRGASRTQVVGLALITSGGLGNLIDRLLNEGAVVDFIVLGRDGLIHTGVFNVADVAILAGILLFLLMGGRQSGRG